MLDLGDLLTLIRLTELELNTLQADIDGDDEQAKNDAGEVIVQVDTLANKLKKMYLNAYSDDCGYPNYEEYIQQFRR